MDARHVVLVAFGVGKAEAVAQLVEGPVSAMWPATILQHHPHKTVLVDEAAAGRDRKSTRLNSSHVASSYAVFCLKKKKGTRTDNRMTRHRGGSTVHTS